MCVSYIENNLVFCKSMRQCLETTLVAEPELLEAADEPAREPFLVGVRQHSCTQHGWRIVAHGVESETQLETIISTSSDTGFRVEVPLEASEQKPIAWQRGNPNKACEVDGSMG